MPVPVRQVEQVTRSGGCQGGRGPRGPRHSLGRDGRACCDWPFEPWRRKDWKRNAKKELQRRGAKRRGLQKNDGSLEEKSAEREEHAGRERKRERGLVDQAPEVQSRGLPTVMSLIESLRLETNLADPGWAAPLDNKATSGKAFRRPPASHSGSSAVGTLLCTNSMFGKAHVKCPPRQRVVDVSTAAPFLVR